ncbi:DUF3048 C-terminal domain-containing protein [Gemmiger sp.]
MRKLQAVGGAAALLAALLLGGCGTAQPVPDATPEQAATAAPTAEPTAAPASSANPLTGLDDADYTGKRPVAVMLRTLDGAQPQWGIATADVLVEGVTEGNTAGLMAIFADADSIAKAGPVGPGRDLFLQAALPLNAVPVSIDKNIYAANLLNTLGYQDLDGYHIGKAAFAFDQGRQDAGYREENCFYTTGELIRSGLTAYGASPEGENTPLFRFGTREEVSPENRNGMNLTVTFSKSDSEQLNYNTGTGLYEKLNADGSPMTDADNGQQAAFTNVFVLYASSGIKDDGYTRQYDMTGGTGLYLHGGAWEQINWTKEDATGPFVLTDADGAPLTVAPGKSFIAIWGGYYGQALTLTAADGTEQTLPEKPALLESGISDEAAAAAEADMDAAQRLVDAQAVIDQANADLAEAQTTLTDAQTALDADPENADLIAARDAARTRIDELNRTIADNQAILDAAPTETPVPEETPAPEEGEQSAEEPAAES